jgi:hypothetical protein
VEKIDLITIPINKTALTYTRANTTCKTYKHVQMYPARNHEL